MESSETALYPYQQRWVNDHRRFKIGMMARQTGKTFTCTLEVVLDCLDKETAGQKARWVILSRGERQAREAMEEGVKRHLRAFQAAFEALEYSWEPEILALEVRLPGGSRITALPANPDTARGFSAGVLLDEFAFHKESHAIWRALYPVVAAGHPIRVVSTPNGKGNRFYELMTDPHLAEVWSRHYVDINTAVAEGLPRNVEELKSGMSDPDGWAQEFELQWVDEASAWLSYDLINGCESALAGKPEQYSGGPCFVGVDIAIRNDLFVAWVLEAVGDVFWTREIVSARRISFAEQDAILEDLFRRYRVLRLCMDQTGMGEKMVEDARRRYGTTRVEGVLFTQTAKLELAIVGKEAFEDRKIRIPRGNPELRADLHKLQKTTSPTGAPRFLAASDEAGHADRAWACFLALCAAATPPGPVEYQTVARRRFAPAALRRPERKAGEIYLQRGAW